MRVDCRSEGFASKQKIRFLLFLKTENFMQNLTQIHFEEEKKFLPSSC